MSYSSLAELERCGYRYYLERELRLPERHPPARAGEDHGVLEARLRGTIVHMLLESVDFTRPKPPSVDDVGRLARTIGAHVGGHERQEIAALIARALAAEPARLLQTVPRARREHPFAFSLAANEPLVTGFLDLIVEKPDGATLIVDYKSDRLSGGEDRVGGLSGGEGPGDGLGGGEGRGDGLTGGACQGDRLSGDAYLEALVARDYGFQRLLYALAAIEHGAHEVEVAHWFLERPHRWVSARFVAHERHELRERLLARVARARAGGFAVTHTPHRGICLTCPGRGGLCSWGETHTMRARSATLESNG